MSDLITAQEWNEAFGTDMNIDENAKQWIAWLQKGEAVVTGIDQTFGTLDDPDLHEAHIMIRKIQHRSCGDCGIMILSTTSWMYEGVEVCLPCYDVRDKPEQGASVPEPGTPVPLDELLQVGDRVCREKDDWGTISQIENSEHPYKVAWDSHGVNKAFSYQRSSFSEVRRLASNILGSGISTSDKTMAAKTAIECNCSARTPGCGWGHDDWCDTTRGK